MRLGDIFPKEDVVLVLGDNDYKINPPSLETLGKIEQWFEAVTGQKKRWHQIFGDSTNISTKNFAEFIKILLDASNDISPTLEGLMKMINTANFSYCCEAILRAVKSGSPEPDANNKNVSNTPAAWDVIMRHGLEVGIGYDEMKHMTIRELYGVLVDHSKTEKEKEPLKLHPNYNPKWREELRQKNVVPRDWVRQYGAKPAEKPLTQEDLLLEVSSHGM